MVLVVCAVVDSPLTFEFETADQVKVELAMLVPACKFTDNG